MTRASQSGPVIRGGRAPTAGIFGSLDNALVRTAADLTYLGWGISVVILTMVGLAPLSYPLVGAAIEAWGAAPVFVGCGCFASPV